MKILHLHTLPVVSGSGINTFLSMRGQMRAGHEVELACAPEGRLQQWVEKEGMRFRPLNHMVWGLNPLKDLAVVIEIILLIRRESYEVIHTHNSKAGFVGRLAGFLSRKPLVIHTVHGFAFHDAERRWKCRLYRFCERLAAHWCDHMIVISQPLIDWAVRERIAGPEKMTKIYSGIDIECYHSKGASKILREELGLSEKDFIIGEVAKLWEGKGHQYLLEAVAMLKDRIPNLKCLLVGTGDLRPELEDQVETLGIGDRVIFTGFREDIPAVTQLLDVSVLPSLFEGMGRAVLEGQAAGKAVIGTRVGGIPDIIEHERTGLLIPPADAPAIAESIWRLYSEPELRNQLGFNAARAVNEQFSAERMNREILQVYEKHLGARQTGK